MNSIIVRRASDDFYAVLTANAMQSLAGVEVVSVVCDPRNTWHVFAKYRSGIVTTDDIDRAIDDQVYGSADDDDTP